MSRNIVGSGTDFNNIGDIGALGGRPITQGTTKKGEMYNRNINFGPGYEELARIVAGLGKDVKRINQCLTKAGAIEYASKRRNWTAHEADITGANGKPDGIKEVFVCDGTGNVKVINGVGLAKTTYPTRKAYRTLYTSKEARKEKPYGSFMKEIKTIHAGDFDSNGAPYYENDLSDLGEEFKGIRPTITVRELYKQVVFQPVYDEMKQSLKDAGVPPMIMAQIYNKSLSAAFNNHVKNQVLAEILGEDPDNVAKKLVNKTLRSKEYKEECENKITKILEDKGGEFSTCQGEIQQLISETTDELVDGVQAPPPRQATASPFRTPNRGVPSP